MRRSKSVVLVVGVVSMIVSCARAQDWPQWRGANRDAKISGFTAPSTWPKELKSQWKVTVGLGDATPALVGKRLYVFARQGDEEVAMCLNADDGKEIWRDKHSAPAVTGGPRDHSGPRSTPTVADGKVVILGVAGVLTCLDAAGGKVLWTKDEFPGGWPRFYAAMSPIVVDGLCIAHLGKEGAGAIVAYDLASGDPKWKWTGGGPTYASPVLMILDGAKTLVVHAESDLLGISAADGKLLWQVAVPVRQRFYSSVTPIVDGRTVIYTGQGTGTKAIRIEKTGDGYAVKELWSNDDVGTGYNTPVLKNGLLFGISDPGNNFFCMSARDGKTLWTDTIKYSRFGTMIDAGPVLLTIPASDLLVIEPTDAKYAELARYKVAQEQVYAFPIVAGNRIYVKDKDSLTLWTLE
ncbi:MAG TPA: PQQ-like beta-propeller repeat protein [Sedimentisphaerales bacterium]|jgi:outer membrane protein assembly factor BamB|nr:PQQ-like beta-propeller repeat protein [Sedimentisphaerales bacterium]HNU27840.1 PQQ-like beta-propeller repeat protein [Sedimentisphaerales bacterium]